MIATHRAEAAHLFRRVGAPTSEILSAESANRGCRETGGLPTRRALYTQKSGPRQWQSRTCGACHCRGPDFWIDHVTDNMLCGGGDRIRTASYRPHPVLGRLGYNMFAGPERVHRAIPIDRVTSASTPLDSPCKDLAPGGGPTPSRASPGPRYARRGRYVQVACKGAVIAPPRRGARRGARAGVSPRTSNLGGGRGPTPPEGRSPRSHP